MTDILHTLCKLHHYRLPVLGVCGLILTLAFSSPGTSIRVVGPLRLDMFYTSTVVCGALILSILVLGEYDPEEYNL